jgi:hypothetical protein
VVWIDEEAPGIVRFFCSDTLSVRLCRFESASTRCTFWRLLGGEGNWLEGLTSGPTRALEASEGICLLASRPMHDPIGGVVDSTAPVGRCWGEPRRLKAPVSGPILD